MRVHICPKHTLYCSLRCPNTHVSSIFSSFHTLSVVIYTYMHCYKTRSFLFSLKHQCFCSDVSIQVGHVLIRILGDGDICLDLVIALVILDANCNFWREKNTYRALNITLNSNATSYNDNQNNYLKQIALWFISRWPCNLECHVYTSLIKGTVKCLLLVWLNDIINCSITVNINT